MTPQELCDAISAAIPIAINEFSSSLDFFVESCDVSQDQSHVDVVLRYNHQRKKLHLYESDDESIDQDDLYLAVLIEEALNDLMDSALPEWVVRIPRISVGPEIKPDAPKGP